MSTTKFYKIFWWWLIIEQCPSRFALSTTSTRVDIYDSISSILEQNGLSWKSYLVVCTDGTPAMTGRNKGFLIKIKKYFPNVSSTHCFIHREVLMVKTIPTELKIVLDIVVNVVNVVKAKAFKITLLKQICLEVV